MVLTLSVPKTAHRMLFLGHHSKTYTMWSSASLPCFEITDRESYKGIWKHLVYFDLLTRSGNFALVLFLPWKAWKVAKQLGPSIAVLEYIFPVQNPQTCCPMPKRSTVWCTKWWYDMLTMSDSLVTCQLVLEARQGSNEISLAIKGLPFLSGDHKQSLQTSTDISSNYRTDRITWTLLSCLQWGKMLGNVKFNSLSGSAAILRLWSAASGIWRHGHFSQKRAIFHWQL